MSTDSLSCCFTFSLVILPGSSLVLRLGELVMQAAFYPLLCAACGGSWRSLLGECSALLRLPRLARLTTCSLL
jgi:hypothetical protein